MYIPVWIIVAVIICAMVLAGKAEESDAKIDDLENRLDEMEGDSSSENEFSEIE